MKLAMAMSPMIGEEESRRQEQIHARLEREERAKSRGKFRAELTGESRRSFLFLLGAAVMFFLLVNSERFQTYTEVVSQKLAARAAAHSTIKQSALKYEDEVDQIAKQ